MEYVLHIMILVAIYSILSMSLDVIIGYAGIPALGHAAFALLGAYTSSLLALNFNMTPWLGMFLGAIISSILGAIVAYPSVKLKGDYLSLATLGLGIVVYVIAKKWVSLTRGPMGLSGIPTLSLWGHKISEEWQYCILVWFIAIMIYLLLRMLMRRPFGRVLKSIREDDIAAMSLGKNVNMFKLKIFLVGAFFAGLAGSLYAHYITFIDPSSFSVMKSITILLMVVLGGMGTLKGSVLGAFLIVVIPELLRFVGLPLHVAAPLRQMIYGLTLTLLVIYRPHGIMGKCRWN